MTKVCKLSYFGMKIHLGKDVLKLIEKPLDAGLGDRNTGSPVRGALAQCGKSWLRIRPAMEDFFESKSCRKSPISFNKF